MKRVLLVGLACLHLAACFYRPGDTYACNSTVDCLPLGFTFACLENQCVDSDDLGEGAASSGGSSGRSSSSNSGGGSTSSSSGSSYSRPDVTACTGECSSGGCPVKLEAGSDFICALMRDTTLRCWGGSDARRLGRPADGDVAQSTPGPVLDRDGGPLTNVVSMSLGEQHACAVLDGGNAYCWGANYAGQLGPLDGGVSDSKRAIKVNLSGVRGVAAGYVHTCFLLPTETRCYGSNNYGQTGNNGVVPTSFTTLVSGDFTVYGLFGDGTAQGWGNNDSSQLTAAPNVFAYSADPHVLNVSGVTSLAANASNACVVTQGEQALCWGDTQFDVTGWNDHNEFEPNPVESAAGGALGSVRKVALGSVHACAILTDGSVWCWGASSANQRGEFYDDTQAWMAMQSNTLGSNRDLAAGDRFTCTLNDCGQVHCWGENDYGQLGTPDGGTSKTAVRVNFP
ncbi:MAG: hypothetical protein AB2A00_41340 [Myxococcota bacterium]